MLAAENSCDHPNRREISTHMSHWTTSHNGCTVNWTVDRVSGYCDDCQKTLYTYDRQVGVHNTCGQYPEIIINHQ